jgi:DNA-binding HxlR family transcriptional regulator
VDRDVDHSIEICDARLTRVFDFLGKRWNGMIVGALSSGPAGFSTLSRAINGISDSMLSQRLGGLGDLGIVARTVEAGPPVAVTYRLTDAGRALLPALAMLAKWADENPAASPCSAVRD